MSLVVTIGVILGAMIFMGIAIYIFEKETIKSIKEIDDFIANRCAKMDGGDYADFLDWERIESIADTIMRERFATDNNVGDKKQRFLLRENGDIVPLTICQQWIPVTERLPEIDQPCLCYKERKGHTCYQLGTYLGAMFSENCAAFKSMSHYGCIGVTHWMPLPEPPKGE